VAYSKLYQLLRAVSLSWFRPVADKAYDVLLISVTRLNVANLYIEYLIVR